MFINLFRSLALYAAFVIVLFSHACLWTNLRIYFVVLLLGTLIFVFWLTGPGTLWPSGTMSLSEEPISEADFSKQASICYYFCQGCSLYFVFVMVVLGLVVLRTGSKGGFEDARPNQPLQ